MHDRTPDPIDLLADRLAETAALIDSATHRFLTDLRAFDAALGWRRQGALSCAHWLSWRCGIDLGAAREKVRVAQALGSLPLIDGALHRGEISFSKVRAMTRVASPENEETLLEYARHTTAAQLERICRLTRRAEPSSEPIEQRRWLRVTTTDDGMVRVEAQLTADEAALVLKACEVSAEGGKRVDGLVALAERTVRGEATERSPVEVLVQIEAGTLEGSTESGAGVSAETSRRLLCDAGIVPVLEDGQGKTLDVGRKTRTVPAALKRALRLRDKGCRFPGCSNKRADAHHLEHWIEGGETRLDNLAMLCRRHHTLVHEDGFGVRWEEGALTFLDRDGAPIAEAAVPQPLSFDGLERVRTGASAEGLSIGPLTNLPAWNGETPDYALAVEGLL